MTSKELRQKYLDFFKSKGHAIIPSASLIPENDPTVLFTTAGMHPLVPYLMGEPHPEGKRLVDVQKSVRTTDIDEVGDNRHLTFFEMLGNWSLGDPDAPDGVGAGYFKKEAIEWSFEFLTSKQWLGIPLEKLAVSVFEGDATVPRDDESAAIWQSLSVPKERIAYLGRDDNWWGPAGQTGPCGPDTEMFYWIGSEHPPVHFDPKDPQWVEIWNDVFMQYNKVQSSQQSAVSNEQLYDYVPLKQKNVDTGMGLERTVAVLSGSTDVYAIDTFQAIIKTILDIAGATDQVFFTSNERAIRIIADHVRAVTFIIGDSRGVVPSNVDQGYVVRRLIRRAVRYGKHIGIQKQFTAVVACTVIEQFSGVYPELQTNKERILSELQKEEEKFAQTLAKGLKEFEQLFLKSDSLSGEQAFILYSTYGFPLELSQELAQEKGQRVDEDIFHAEFKKHQELSRAGSEQKFHGGLADHSWEVIRQHTATHLLQQALRDVLGEHVCQKGSNITRERLRFDFTHPTKMTPEEVKRVEDIVNAQIRKDHPVHFEMLSVDEAKARGAIGLFEDKYSQLGNKIKVYFVGDYSKEICGGPHVEHTGQVGGVKIMKEEAVSQGVRRIKAVLTEERHRHLATAVGGVPQNAVTGSRRRREKNGST